jgi:hypothetical protein
MMRRRSDLPPAANEASALLSKIVSDDVEEGPPPPKGPKRKGRPPKTKPEANDEEAERLPSSERNTAPAEDHSPRLRRGVANDRVLSVVDPEMRCGHKSQRQTWAG